MRRRIEHHALQDRRLVHDGTDIGRPSRESHGKQGKNQGRFRQRGHDRFTTATHSTKSRSGIQARQHQEKGP